MRSSALLAGALCSCASLGLAQPGGAAPAYVDRVLDTGAQADAGQDADVQAYDAQGWPRSLRLDYALSSTRGPSASLSRAIAFSGFLDTPEHGALSLSANLISSQTDGGDPAAPASVGASGTTWRIDQRALPLEGGWLASHSAGDINTVTPRLARGTGRIFLPTTPIAGAAGQWTRGDQVDLNAAAGRTGLFSGLDANGFDSSAGGRLASAGGQVRLDGDRASDSRLDAAWQVVDARDIPGSASAGAQAIRSVWSSLAWEGAAPWGGGMARGQAQDSVALRPGGLRLQANWLQSSASLDGSAAGAWIDGAWRTALLQNTAGVFHFQPGLRWGPTVAASDLRGAYWRAEMSARQWQAGWSTELSRSVSGLYGASGFGSLFGRYRLDTRNTVGATLSLRTGSGAAQSLQLSWDRGSDWGRTQWRGDLMRAPGARNLFVGVDHAWPLAAPMAFATSLGWQRGIAAGAVDSTAWTWGLLSSYSPSSGFSMNASLRGAQGNGASALFANIGAVWQLQPGWSLVARYSEARGQDPQSLQVVSALTAATLTPLAPAPASRSLQLVLRYEARAGSASVPLGGAPGAGAGRLSGTVYFDADNNGRRDASEGGAANVTVVLDRRFVARTDAQGRYEFPAVVAGEHLIQVQPDNVPLPWSPVAREPVKTTVLVRGSTVEDFALQRER